jgi:hypothetical protein
MVDFAVKKICRHVLPSRTRCLDFAIQYKNQVLYFQLRKIYSAKYFSARILLFACSFLRPNIITDRNKFLLLRREQSPIADLTH